MTFSLFDVVSLVQDLPEEGLHAGMIGAVIEVYVQPVPAYEVEFCDPSGKTIAQLALFPEQLRLTGDSRG